MAVAMPTAKTGTRRRSRAAAAADPLVDLQACIARLEQIGQLVRVKTEVDPRHELAGIAKRFEGGPSVLFERVAGSRFPVLIGLLWNRATVGQLFGLAKEEVPFRIAAAISPWRADRSALAPRLLERAPANEVVAIAEKRGQPLPVTINNGVGLAPWIVSTLPRLGDGKPTIAHHLVGRPIDWVRARTVDVPAYADAQFVIEAEIVPGVREAEAPFAEVTGYYGQRAERWVMRVKAITRRAQPVFHTVLSGKEVWNAVGFTAEAAIFAALKDHVPEVRAVYLPPGGCGFYAAVVQVENARPGLGPEVIRRTFAAFKSLQRVTVVDTDVDLFDPVDVEWATTTRFDPGKDLVLLPDQEGHILNPVVTIDADGKGGRITKIGIDAMAPYQGGFAFQRVQFQPVDLSKYEIAR